MKKFLYGMRNLNSLSALILHYGTQVSLLMFVITILLTYIQNHIRALNTILAACARVYPLLTLMVLSITIISAFLIDIYAKVHKK